tara:strand:+ start:24 stop:566 length:543 start_codon:yes stop_codon:yes gene_type:complete
MKVLIDFDDSFTYNVAQFFLDRGIDLEVVHWKQFKYRGTGLYVFGPGPGHPDDYLEIQKTIESILKNKDNFVFGICLGHQLVLSALGLSIKPLRAPNHGVSLNLKLNKYFANYFGNRLIQAQFYNSLGVLKSNEILSLIDEIYCQDDLILLSKGENFFTSQFHLESIGTISVGKFLQKLL